MTLVTCSFLDTLTHGLFACFLSCPVTVLFSKQHWFQSCPIRMKPTSLAEHWKALETPVLCIRAHLRISFLLPVLWSLRRSCAFPESSFFPSFLNPFCQMIPVLPVGHHSKVSSGLTLHSRCSPYLRILPLHHLST